MTFSNMSYVIGVDLGGSNVRASLFDAAGAAVAELAEPTAGSAAAVVAQLGHLGRRLARRSGVEWEAIDGVGVGVPGVVADGRLRMAPNLPPFGDVEVGVAFADELDAEVIVDNDVNMATLGEHCRGLGDGLGDFVFLAIGTGVGMGMVAGGRLLRGAHGAAGEIGTVPLVGLASAGLPLTLEDLTGGAGVARRYAEVAQRDDLLTAAEVHAAADAGDPAAREVVEAQIRAVALAAVAIQRVLDPALVVLGGGIGSRADFALRVREQAEALAAEPVRLEPSALGDAAGVIGAAQAARLHVKEQVDV
jgi:glucokinase